MPAITRFGSARVLSGLIALILCAFCLQPLCGCAGEQGEGDEGVVAHAVKYAYSRTMLDMSLACVVGKTPDATVEISFLGLKDAPDGGKEIELEPTVVSDTMASWGPSEWAQNRDDLFFNLAAHFNVICKQAREYGDIPENYTVTSPDYMVVYDSKKENGFVVTSKGVYRKTDDPENPIGELVVLTNSDE